jgi:hypothetical protein
MDQLLAPRVVFQRTLLAVHPCGLILLSMEILPHHGDSPCGPFIKQENEIPGCYRQKDSQIQLLLFHHALPRNVPMPHLARL